MTPSRSRLAAILAGAIALSLVAGGVAEARRGGSFGSRGSRTYTAPRSTYTSPGYVPPVQRSMTAPPSGYSNGGYNPNGYNPNGYNRPAATPAPYGAGYGQAQGPFYRRPGFGGGLLTGLATGGLLGAMLGHGWGGMGGGWGAGMGGGAGLGFLATLLQLGLLALVVWMVVRLFRRRNDVPQPAGFPASAYDPGPTYEPGPAAGGPWGAPTSTGPWGAPPDGAAANVHPVEIPITPADRQAFERLLAEVQEAFGREDYGALRERTTPEVMSYLAEELSQNATHNRRNDVSRTRLLRSDVAEAWREDDKDYATVALNYESVDVMRDRQTGQVVEGDPSTPTQTTEVWTFVRPDGGPWKLSAIQET